MNLIPNFATKYNRKVLGIFKIKPFLFLDFFSIPHHHSQAFHPFSLFQPVEDSFHFSKIGWHYVNIRNFKEPKALIKSHQCAPAGKINRWFLIFKDLKDHCFCHPLMTKNGYHRDRCQLSCTIFMVFYLCTTDIDPMLMYSY